MRYQYDNWTCGPVAVINAAEAMGKVLSLKRAIKAARSSQSRGTSSKGIIRAVEAAGLTTSPYSLLLNKKYPKYPRVNRASLLSAAWGHLAYTTKHGYPTVVCVQNDSHWVTTLGFLDSHLIVMDPEKGVQVIDKESFPSYIGNKTKTFTAITVLRRT